MIYRCGCCLLSGTARYKVAWCCVHKMYECRSCWRHAHHNTRHLWGEDCEESVDADQD